MNRQQELAAALEVIRAYRDEVAAYADVIRAMSYKEQAKLKYGPADYERIVWTKDEQIEHLASGWSPTSDWEAERLLAIAKQFSN